MSVTPPSEDSLHALVYSREWTDPSQFPSLSYRRNWENPTDFPTVETDEETVRADMQALYDEIKDYVNGEGDWSETGLRPYIVATGNYEAAVEDAEADRVAAEAERVLAEEGRVSAEEGRVSAENARNVWENYNDLKTYVPGNKVYYQGSSYVCIVTATSILPTNTSYWQIVAKQGESDVAEHNVDPDAHANLYIRAGRKDGTTLGERATAEGYRTTASGPNSHAEGADTTASGSTSHAEGAGTTASNYYSHAEGVNTTASGNGYHAEGVSTTASGNHSHAEGAATTASGNYSHAEGSGANASGSTSHAEGAATTASGDSSHAEGYGTTANHKSQHVFGEYNVADTSSEAATARGDFVEIVGKGTQGAPSNARTLDWSGNEWLAGKLTLGAGPSANKDAATKKYVDDGLSGKAQTNHASTATTYGKGTSDNYGHLKLSDSTSSTSGTSDGTAATPSAVKAAYDLAAVTGKYNGKLVHVKSFSISIPSGATATEQFESNPVDTILSVALIVSTSGSNVDTIMGGFGMVSASGKQIIAQAFKTAAGQGYGLVATNEATGAEATGTMIVHYTLASGE